jgi:hypothetical protein
MDEGINCDYIATLGNRTESWPATILTDGAYTQVRRSHLAGTVLWRKALGRADLEDR